MNNFLIYNSSAGSGKTFTLTKEFLKLVLVNENPRYIQNILAITFTNAATQEMKERVMDSLKDMAESDSNAYINLIGKELGLSKDVLRTRAENSYQFILHNYSQLSIMTLDSFSSKVVNAFKFDLNLPYTFETLLDLNDVIGEAVEDLLMKVGEEGSEELETILREFAKDRLDNDKSSINIQRDIAKSFEKYMRETQKSNIQFDEFSLEDWNEITFKCKETLKKTLNSCKDLIENLLSIINSKGLEVVDFKRGANGGLLSKLESFLILINNKEWKKLFDSFPYTSTIQEGIDQGDWYSKTSSKKEIIDAIHPILSSKLTEFEKLLNEGTFLLFKFLEKEYYFKLNSFLTDSVNRILAERNQVPLSEFNKKIENVIRTEPVPYIYERLAEKYNHILIDEFQDTSPRQFTNLLPLFENTLIDNKVSMIVGDVKQAIYAFRGGDYRLFKSLLAGNENELLETIDAEEFQVSQSESLLQNRNIKNLEYNYRSAKEIVEFNNAFFGTIAEATSYDSVREIYSHVHQKINENTKSGGHVSIEFFSDEESDERLLEQISQLISFGYRYSDIAILTRSNGDAQSMAQLLQTNGISVNSFEALNIKNRIEVCLLVEILKLKTNPQDSLIRFHVLQYYALVFNIQWNTIEEILGGPISTFFQFLSLNSVSDLSISKALEDDFYKSTEYLIQYFGFWEKSDVSPYVLKFLDVVLEFIQTKSPDIHEFLYYWNSKSNISINAEDTNGVVISTIHKSKGLEYPVVILPRFSYDFFKKPSEEWVDISELNVKEFKTSSGVEFKNLVLNINQKPDSPLFKVLEKYYVSKILETINETYVAFTRPTERLYVFSQIGFNAKGDLKEYSSNTNSFLLDYFRKKSIVIQDAMRFVVFEGVPQKINQTTSPQILREKIEPQAIDFDSTQFQLRFSSYQDIVRPEIVLGNSIHQYLEKIRTTIDFEKARQEIQEGDFGNEEKEFCLSILNNLESSTDLSVFFDENSQILIEKEILQKGIPIRRPDRIVLQGNKAWVMDYKTGQKSPGHKSQIKEYKDLLASMGYSIQKAYLVYLHDFEIEEVV
ncbi:MAG: UvrD-helicase domain-containing protein [Leadbetterella sp.]